MAKKNYYCEKLNTEEQDQMVGGSWGGTDAGGPTSGGNAACICACGGLWGAYMDWCEERVRDLIA